MPATLYWMQAGACGGDTWSLLSLESPDLAQLLEQLELQVLWHPSLSNLSAAEHDQLVESITSGATPLDFLCVEGSVIQGPGGTGMFDTSGGRAKKDLVARLAARARHVIAVGTCASFGGLCADGATEATGLQFHKTRKGGFLGEGFLAGSGLPVVNIPGCPAHHDAVASTLAALAANAPLQLNEHNAPLEHFGLLVHQGCLRNEYHEYRVEERDFGERGCLFFHLGCRGPLAYGPCNKLLWNHRSSKTRVGVPCVGCTEPSFPKAQPFFSTRALAEIPIELPHGVDRAHYLAYKGMAAAAAPERLKRRKTRV
ncbi:MAG: NADH:ubiquinone oxidoreductase [Deltaproteobacteria bacterium]|nr:NADH:ubiquinone oxidoreductase [Deltaproteobacteria bacterium]